jgi:putative transposase
MVSHHQRSERRACALVGLSRDAYRHPPVESSLNAQLRQRIVQLAHERRRWGYRMIGDALRPEYPGINAKRVYRLYRAEGLSIRKRKKTKRLGVRVPLVPAQTANQTWSMDFVSDTVAKPGLPARRIKCLTVTDDFTRECVDIAADYGMGGAYVTRLLDQAATFSGYPQKVRTDNGPEFTCRAFMTWAQAHGIRHILIEPGSPTQSAYIESFNGTLRDECLDENWFESLAQARQAIATWRRDYNEIRPHSSCGRVPPATFAPLQDRCKSKLGLQPRPSEDWLVRQRGAGQHRDRHA